MSNSENNHNEESFVNFRLNKLEEAVTTLVQNLSTLKDIVVRWDSRMGEGSWPLKCNLHQERMDNLNKRLDEQDSKMENMTKEIQEMKSVIWKASGALIILSIVVQLLGPMMLEKVLGHSDQPKIELIEK